MAGNGKILIVGGDESNHASKNRKGEIIVATFSFDQEDSIVQDFGRRRNHSALQKWLASEGRDSRFTIIHDEILTRFQPLVPLVMPYLIDPFLQENPDIETLKLYVDGRLTTYQKGYLRGHFEHLVPNFIIDNFVKKNRNSRCPTSVYMVDVLANRLYKTPFDQLAEDKRFIPMSVEREKKLIDLICSK